MKALPVTFLFAALLFVGCKKDSPVVKGYYDSMHFVRQGGGQIDFSLTLSDHKARISVSRFDFRDTSLQVILDDSDAAFSSLYKAMNNQTAINGDFQQSTLPTGTWAYIYLIADKKETEVTNTDLRNALLKIEQLVRDKIQ